MSELLVLPSAYRPLNHLVYTSPSSKPSTQLSPLLSYCCVPHSCKFSAAFLSYPRSLRPCHSKRAVHRRAFDSPSSPETENAGAAPEANQELHGAATGKQSSVGDGGSVTISDHEFPSGEFEFEPVVGWKKLVVKLKMLLAFPWERVRKGSVLTMKLRGEISEQQKSRLSQGLSLPQICENFIKAAYDPRISGIYLQIDSLSCGWGKVEEIRRHILDFRKSGKFVVTYTPLCQEKEYYLACACDEIYAPPSAYLSLSGLTVQASFLRGVLDKIGIEPQVERIGKYKSAGDQLIRRSISEENSEMLTALLDNIYTKWLDVVSSSKGISREDMENFINEGVYQVDRLKEKGLITGIRYDDEVITLLKERLGVEQGKDLSTVDYRKYSRVRKWTLGITGGKDKIAIIRASGSISRVKGGLLSLPGSGIISEQFIENIHTVRESKRYKAAIIRIDSPGGDALASDLMWREIKLLAASIPVVASMSDVAASGGYYMAMAANTIVAESLTITGSIGVVTGKFNLQKLYERIGFNKEVISRGRYAELFEAEQRPFRPDEAELFAKSALHAYKQFRDKAAFSRSMDIDKMEDVAQGRVWSGKDAASRGLVDAIGGLSRAIAIAKLKAGISQDQQVTLVEISDSSSLSGILSGIEIMLARVYDTFKAMVEVVTNSNGVQARMDGIMFSKMQGFSNSDLILTLIKDIIRSL